MTSSAIIAVLRWATEAERQRDAAGLTPAQISTATILSLIHVESAGDPYARRPQSQYCGLLQMGRLAGIDVGYPDRGRNTTAPLLGDGATAIRQCLRYLVRYQSRHDWVGWRVAALWKGGPGTASTVEELLRGGATKHAALASAATRHGIEALVEYVRRYDAAMELYGGRE